jgi:hypothetical protein
VAMLRAACRDTCRQKLLLSQQSVQLELCQMLLSPNVSLFYTSQIFITPGSLFTSTHILELLRCSFPVCILLCIVICSSILAVNRTIKNKPIELFTLVLFNKCYILDHLQAVSLNTPHVIEIF